MKIEFVNHEWEVIIILPSLDYWSKEALDADYSLLYFGWITWGVRLYFGNGT